MCEGECMYLFVMHRRDAAHKILFVLALMPYEGLIDKAISMGVPPGSSASHKFNIFTNVCVALGH